MSDFFAPQALTALFQVITIDLVLAGDNAIVIGLAAAGLPAAQRNKAILIGIGAATLLRVVFAALTTQLLQIVGLLLAGGILLLWVSWKMWRELRSGHERPEPKVANTLENEQLGRRKTLRQATWQIVLADVSMSLDNVLAVAGAARDYPYILIFGLAFSIVLMGLAAQFIASLLNHHRWIGFVGLAIIVYVAFEMIYRGSLEVWPALSD